MVGKVAESAKAKWKELTETSEEAAKFDKGIKETKQAKKVKDTDKPKKKMSSCN